MIHFIANYEVEGTITSTLTDLKLWLRKHKLYVIDCETAMSEWVEDQVPISYQIGDKYDQWVIDARDCSIESLKSILEQESSIKIGHNIKFDYKVIKTHADITLENVWDTMLGEQILYTGLTKPKGFYGLEQTHERYFNSNPYGPQLSLFDPFITKKTRAVISKKTVEPLTFAEIFYGAMDLVTAHKVYEAQKAKLEENKLLRVARLENEFVLVLGDMELNGMPIDVERWIELSQYSEQQLNHYLTLLKALQPSVNNWNSHTQVKALFRELGIPIVYQDKESIQEVVIKEHAAKFPIIEVFLKYKKFQKLSSTYGVEFLKHVNPHTGRIHPSYLQIMSTGRTSCTNPNLQNIVSEKADFPEGKWWREAFKTNKNFTIADYSQQELRVVADISKDEELIKIFKEDRDPHREAASALFNKPLDAVTSPERKDAKTFNFAVLYGASGFKIAKTLGKTKKEGETLIKNYYSRFKGLKAFQDSMFEFSLEHGYIVTDKIGRRSYIENYERMKTLKPHIQDPDFNSEYKSIQGSIFRNSCNYKIQGTAALIAKTAGIEMRKYLRANPNAFDIVLLEHDCWIAEHEDLSMTKVIENCLRIAAERYCSIEIPAEGLVTNKWSK